MRHQISQKLLPLKSSQRSINFDVGRSEKKSNSSANFYSKNSQGRSSVDVSELQTRLLKEAGIYPNEEATWRDDLSLSSSLSSSPSNARSHTKRISINNNPEAKGVPASRDELDVAERILPQIKLLKSAPYIKGENANFGQFDPFESELLVQSEILIEKQRDRLKYLKEQLAQTDGKFQVEQSRLKNECAQLKDSNAKLRLEIDLLQGELAVRGDGAENSYLSEACLRHEMKLKNTKIEELSDKLIKLQSSGKQWEDVKLENSQLKRTLDKLSARNLMTSDENINAEERSQLLQAKIASDQKQLNSLRIQQDEARLATLAVVDGEFELMEARETIKSQKNMLLKFQKAMDAANREKSLIPPTFLIVRDEREVSKLSPDFALMERRDVSGGGSQLASAESQEEFQKQLYSMLESKFEEWEGLARTLRVECISANTVISSDQGKRQTFGNQIDLQNPNEELFCIRLRHKYIPNIPVEEALASVLSDLNHDLDWPSTSSYDKYVVFKLGEICIYKNSETSLPESNLVHIVKSSNMTHVLVTDSSPFICVLCLEGNEKDFPAHIFSLDSLESSQKFEKILRSFEMKKPKSDQIKMHNSCVAIFTSHSLPDKQRHCFAATEANIDISYEMNSVFLGDVRIVADNTILEIDKNCNCFKLWCFPTPNDEEWHTVIAMVFEVDHAARFQSLIKPLEDLHWKAVQVSQGEEYLVEIQDLLKQMNLPLKKSLPNLPPLNMEGLNKKQLPLKRQTAPPIKTFKEPLVPAALFQSLRVENGLLQIFERNNDVPILSCGPSNCRISLNPDEFRIQVFKLDDSDTEAIQEHFSFVFDPESYNRIEMELKDNGFGDKSEADDMVYSIRKNVAVVNKGMVRMYNVYGGPEDKPFLTILADQTQVVLSPERREIHLTEKVEEGMSAPRSPRNTRLDCGSEKEFENWRRALTFAGFLEERGFEAFTNLAEYCFPIKMVGESQLKEEYIKVIGTNVNFYKDPKDKNPIFSIQKNKCEVALNVKTRSLQIRANRGEATEERILVIFPTIAIFDQMSDTLRRGGLIVNQALAERATIGIKAQGIISFRTEGILYWKQFADYIGKKPATYQIPSELYFAEKLTADQVYIVVRDNLNITPDIIPHYNALKKITFTANLSDGIEDAQRWAFGLWISRMSANRLLERDPAKINRPIYGFTFPVQSAIKMNAGFFASSGGEKKLAAAYEACVQKRRAETAVEVDGSVQKYSKKVTLKGKIRAKEIKGVPESLPSSPKELNPEQYSNIDAEKSKSPSIKRVQAGPPPRPANLKKTPLTVKQSKILGKFPKGPSKFKKKSS